MGGCRCSYKNCTNTTKTRENLHFFHYPVKQKERCRQWIENANKPQFYDLDEDQLRNKVVCETHFEDRYFPNVQKKRLLQGAIPTLDGDCEKELIQLTTTTLPATPPPPPLPPPVLLTASSGSSTSSLSSTTSSSPSNDVKIQDVQILPANADGTIFVVETNNLSTQYQSEQIESYIYTNNGLVRIVRNVENNGNNIYNNYELINDNQTDGIQETQNSCDTVNNIDYVFSQDSEMKDIGTIIVEDKTSKTREIVKSKQLQQEDIGKEFDNKYLKTIKQHSKDIAYIKKILKLRKRYKPSRTSIINILQKCLPSTLLDIINLHLIPDNKLENHDFFNDIYTKSPELYKLLREKYQWRLPSPNITKFN